MDEECIHLLDPAQCTICNGSDRRREKEDKEVVAMFDAKFSGVCRSCGDVIEAGDRIGRLNNGKYVCEDCAAR
jgi:hypothetical protein